MAMKRDHQQIMKKVLLSLGEKQDFESALASLEKEFFTENYYLQGNTASQAWLPWAVSALLFAVYLFSVVLSALLEFNNGLYLLLELFIFILISGAVFYLHFKAIRQCQYEPFALQDGLERKVFLSRKLLPQFQEDPDLASKAEISYEMNPLEYFDFLQSVKVYIRETKRKAVLLVKKAVKHVTRNYSLSVSEQQKRKIAQKMSDNFVCFMGGMPRCSERQKKRVMGRQFAYQFSAVQLGLA